MSDEEQHTDYVQDKNSINVNKSEPEPIKYNLPEDTKLFEDKGGINIQSFSFLQLDGNSFLYDVSKLCPELTSLKNKFNFITYISLNDDSSDSLLDLKITMDSLNKNAKQTYNWGIKSENILYVIMCNNLQREDNLKYIYPNQAQAILTRPNCFLCSKMQCKSDVDQYSTITTLFVTKNNSHQTECTKMFYTGFLKDICSTEDGGFNQVYSLRIKAGITIQDDAMNQMIISLFNKADSNNQRRVGAAPVVETITTGLFERVQKYERVHFSIFDWHYYNISSSVHLNSEWSLILINQSVFNSMQMFYLDEINVDASISYHDYKLAWYFTQWGHEIVYLPSVIGRINRHELGYTDVMKDYTDINQGLILGNYDWAIKHFLNFKNCNLTKKIASFFHLFGSITNFLFPTFFTMFVYTILVEGFNIFNWGAASFFTIWYSVFMLISILVSSISSDPRKIKPVYFIQFIVYEVYYLFIILTSVPAMHFVNINVFMDPYKFNTAAVVLLILINVVIGFLPYVFNMGLWVENILNLLIYFFIGLPSYTSVFLVHSYINLLEAFGHTHRKPNNTNVVEIKESVNQINEHNTNAHDEESKKGNVLIVLNKNADESDPLLLRKTIFAIWYILINALISCFILLMYTRGRRVNCVLTLSIIYTVYNIIKVAIIVYSKWVTTRYTENLISDPQNISLLCNEIQRINGELGRNKGTRTDNHENGYETNNHWMNNGQGKLPENNQSEEAGGMNENETENNTSLQKPNTTE